MAFQFTECVNIVNPSRPTTLIILPTYSFDRACVKALFQSKICGRAANATVAGHFAVIADTALLTDSIENQ